MLFFDSFSAFFLASHLISLSMIALSFLALISLRCCVFARAFSRQPRVRAMKMLKKIDWKTICKKACRMIKGDTLTTSDKVDRFSSVSYYVVLSRKKPFVNDTRVLSMLFCTECMLQRTRPSKATWMKEKISKNKMEAMKSRATVLFKYWQIRPRNEPKTPGSQVNHKLLTTTTSKT